MTYDEGQNLVPITTFTEKFGDGDDVSDRDTFEIIAEDGNEEVAITGQTPAEGGIFNHNTFDRIGGDALEGGEPNPDISPYHGVFVDVDEDSDQIDVEAGGPRGGDVTLEQILEDAFQNPDNENGD